VCVQGRDSLRCELNYCQAWVQNHKLLVLSQFLSHIITLFSEVIKYATNVDFVINDTKAKSVYFAFEDKDIFPF